MWLSIVLLPASSCRYDFKCKHTHVCYSPLVCVCAGSVYIKWLNDAVQKHTLNVTLDSKSESGSINANIAAMMVELNGA